MLKHHGDAQCARLCGAGDVNPFAVEFDVARVRLDNAVDDLDQGGFTGAVFSQQGLDLPAADTHADVIIGQAARIGLGDMVEGDQHPGRLCWHGINGLARWFCLGLVFGVQAEQLRDDRRSSDG